MAQTIRLIVQAATKRFFSTARRPTRANALGPVYELESRIVLKHHGFFHKISHVVHEVVHEAVSVVHEAEQVVVDAGKAVAQGVEHVVEAGATFVKKELPLIETVALDAALIAAGQPELVAAVGSTVAVDAVNHVKPGQIVKDAVLAGVGSELAGAVSKGTDGLPVAVRAPIAGALGGVATGVLSGDTSLDSLANDAVRGAAAGGIGTAVGTWTVPTALQPAFQGAINSLKQGNLSVQGALAGAVAGQTFDSATILYNDITTASVAATADAGATVASAQPATDMASDDGTDSTSPADGAPAKDSPPAVTTRGGDVTVGPAIRVPLGDTTPFGPVVDRPGHLPFNPVAACGDTTPFGPVVDRAFERYEPVKEVTGSFGDVLEGASKYFGADSGVGRAVEEFKATPVSKFFAWANLGAGAYDALEAGQQDYNLTGDRTSANITTGIHGTEVVANAVVGPYVAEASGAGFTNLAGWVVTKLPAVAEGLAVARAAWAGGEAAAVATAPVLAVPVLGEGGELVSFGVGAVGGVVAYEQIKTTDVADSVTTAGEDAIHSWLYRKLTGRADALPATNRKR